MVCAYQPVDAGLAEKRRQMLNLSLEDKQRAREVYERCNSSIQYFVEYFFPHYITSKIPPFHTEMYELVPRSHRLVLGAPRGFAKSTIVAKFYPLWLALMEKRRDICIISASETLATEHLRSIKRELESNQQLRSWFGDLKSSKWTETHIVLKNELEVNIRAKGAGGQIRGFRPDCIILDDIETDETVESEEQRKKLKDWLFKACLNTLLPEGQLLIIGTVIHPLSVLNDLLLCDNGWTKRKYQAYRDGNQQAGYEIWPDLWPHPKLQERKAEIGTWAFASEFLNDPVFDETAAIKPAMIREWKELPQQLSMVITVDPAYSEEESADFKVASLIGIDEKQNRYLVHYIRTHQPTGEFIDALLTMFTQYRDKITAVGIPSGGTEKEFFKSVINKANERKVYAPFFELKNTFTTQVGQAKRNKGSRIIAALQPLFEQGKYFIHASHIEARDELLSITPNHLPRWDDIADSMAYAEQILQAPIYDSHDFEKSVYETEEQHRGDTGYGL